MKTITDRHLPAVVQVRGAEYRVVIFEPDPAHPLRFVAEARPGRVDRFDSQPERGPNTITGGLFYLPATIDPAERRVALDQMIADVTTPAA